MGSRLFGIPNSDRIGRFQIGVEQFKNHIRSVQAIHSNCIIVYTEPFAAIDGIIYTAVSTYFKPAKSGELIPFYEWVFSRHRPNQLIACRLRDQNNERFTECIYIG